VTSIFGGSSGHENWRSLLPPLKQPHFSEALEQYQSGLTHFGPILGAKLALFILQCRTSTDREIE